MAQKEGKKIYMQEHLIREHLNEMSSIEFEFNNEKNTTMLNLLNGNLIIYDTSVQLNDYFLQLRTDVCSHTSNGGKE